MTKRPPFKRSPKEQWQERSSLCADLRERGSKLLGWVRDAAAAAETAARFPPIPGDGPVGRLRVTKQA